MVPRLDLESGGHFTTDFLLGADRLPPEHRRAYGEYFLAVIRQRGFPLHTASLWNALNFGWSVELGAYLGRAMQVEQLADEAPLPVGAFVQVPITGARVAWAEIVHKEGRDRAHVDDLGIAEPEASGARVGLLRAHQQAVVHEALVLDYAPFETINDADDDDFARAVRRGRLTGDQHLERTVLYPPELAGLDDAAVFARYVMDTYGKTLFDELLRDMGRNVGADERWELLVRSLATVEAIANSTQGICSFGSYHLDTAAYEQDTGSAGSHELFGADAVNDVVGAIIEPPEPAAGNARFGEWQRANKPAYRCVGGLVREYLGRHTKADDVALTAEERALLFGPKYARLVMDVNLAVAQRIGESGLLKNGIHVRLDDDYEGSGIWRATRFNVTPPAESRFGPLVALGLGYADTHGADAVKLPEIREEEAEVERSERGWRVALRAIDVHHADLPLDATALAMIAADAEQVLLEVNCDDGEQPKRGFRPLDRDRKLVRRVHYPLDIYPGVYVRCTVAMGGRLVTAHLKRVAVPQRGVDDELLLYEFNETIYRRDVGLTEIKSPSVLGRRTLADQINEVFRRRGRPTDDGGKALRAEEVVVGLLGFDAAPELTLPIVLALQAGEFEYRRPDYVWFPRITRRTSPRDRSRIRAAREERHIERVLAPRTVPMGLRTFRAGSGRHPSPDKVASYEAARLAYHAENRLPPTLGSRQTWVEPFPLGGEPEDAPEALEFDW